MKGKGGSQASADDLDVQSLAQALYAQANGNNLAQQVRITEMDVQGVHPLAE